MQRTGAASTWLRKGTSHCTSNVGVPCETTRPMSTMHPGPRQGWSSSTASASAVINTSTRRVPTCSAGLADRTRRAASTSALSSSRTPSPSAASCGDASQKSARSCPVPPLTFVALTTRLQHGSSHSGANPQSSRVLAMHRGAGDNAGDEGLPRPPSCRLEESKRGFNSDRPPRVLGASVGRCATSAGRS